MVHVADDPFFRLRPAVALVAAADGVLRRQPTALELQAGTDFVRMQRDWESSVDSALDSLNHIRHKQIRFLVAQVRSAAKAGDLDALGTLSVDSTASAEVLFTQLLRAARDAGRQQQREAESQGVVVPKWSLSESSAQGALTAAVGESLLRSVARITARLMGSSLVQSAIRRALSLVGRAALTAPQVADDVLEFLSDLSLTSVREAVGAAITAAQNEGRRTVLAVAPPARFYVSSEILDRNCCQPCRGVDGTEYETLNAAMSAYPSGGYVSCLGGPRCRGTIIAVWIEE